MNMGKRSLYTYWTRSMISQYVCYTDYHEGNKSKIKSNSKGFKQKVVGRGEVFTCNFEAIGEK